MESRSHALMAGFFTITLILLSTAFALWLGKDRIQRSPYLIATTLSVEGLNVQAAVRYKGIKVGNVTDVDFDEKKPGQILLKLEILPDTPVTASTYATLGYQGVTGIAYVQLDEDVSQTTPMLREPGGMARIPLRPGLMQNLEKRGMAILEQTEELGKRLNNLLDPANQRSLLSAVDNISRTALAWQTLPEKFDPVLTKLPALVEQAQDSFAQFKVFSSDATKTSNNIRQLSASLQANDGAVAKFNQNMDQVSASITAEALPNINALSREARSTMRTLNGTAATLNERPQSLLFGNPPPPPGPGEVGFIAPQK